MTGKFDHGVSSGRAVCPLCRTIIGEDLPTVVANLGSGKYNKTYHKVRTPVIGKRYDRKQRKFVEFGTICRGFVETYEDILTHLMDVL